MMMHDIFVIVRFILLVSLFDYDHIYGSKTNDQGENDTHLAFALVNSDRLQKPGKRKYTRCL
jgi:hypothetical protein